MNKYSLRILLVLLALCMLMSVAACNGSADGSSETTPADIPAGADVETTPAETTAAPVETEPQIETLDPITLSYDDYVTEIAGILPDAEGVTVEGTAIEQKTVKGVAYFHAKDVGTVKISDGTKAVEVTVGKAKLNLIVIMGQSNSGNHFDNATSDITCPLGTA